jgi:hypothetical protein
VKKENPEDVALLMKVYEKFSLETGCPILINLLPAGKEGYEHSWSK